MIWALFAAGMYAVVDVGWRSLLPGASIWQALLWRSLSSSTLLVSAAFLWDGAFCFSGQACAENGPLLLIPVLTGVAGLILFSLALRMASAQLVVPIVNLTGLCVGVWEWGWLNRVAPPGPWGWGALGVACAGLLLWIVPSWRGQEGGRGTLGGVALSLAAVLVWSRGYVDYPVALESVPPLWLAASVEVAMLMFGLIMAVVLRHGLQRPLRGKALWIGLGVALAVWAMTVAYSQLPSTEVGLLSTLTPVLVVFLSRMWLGERVHARDAWAILCLVVANALYFLSLISWT